MVIENADATPPHLNVVLRLGSSGDMLCFLKLVCHGALSLMYAFLWQSFGLHFAFVLQFVAQFW